MRVILEKGPELSREFPDESKARATQRAQSLSWLHGDCGIDVDEEDATIYVRASEYYKKGVKNVVATE
jgi:hypothetical protein